MKRTHTGFLTCTVIIAIVVISALIQSGKSLPFVGADPNAAPVSGIFPAAPNATVGEGNFSIFWITDTQYLSQNNPKYYDSLCRWITNNADKYNCKMVIHTGDIVDTEGNQTQWENANNSMSLLLNAGIPYCWDAGNHDYNATCWIGNRYSAFDPATFAGKAFWVSEESEGKNTAAQFTVGGSDYIIINIEFSAENSTLAWANSILDTHPDAHAIVAMHFYLNRTGGYEAWAADLRRSVLATHPNVFLTLSAHVFPLASSGIRTQVRDRQELVFNRQDKDNGMGASSLRILTFDTAHGIIDVKTFVIYANTFLSDADSQFTLNTTFWNAAAPNETADIPEFPNALAAVFLLAFAAVTIVVLKKRGTRRSRKLLE